MIGIMSWTMICAVMYGYTPMAAMENDDMAPPERRSSMPMSWFDSNNERKTATPTPTPHVPGPLPRPPPLRQRPHPDPGLRGSPRPRRQRAQLAGVDGRVGDAERVFDPTSVGEAPNERQLAALEVRWHAAATAGL